MFFLPTFPNNHSLEAPQDHSHCIESVFQYLLEERALNCGPGETNPFDKHDLVESDDGPRLDELVLENTGVDLNLKVHLVFPDQTRHCFRYIAAIGHDD